MCNRTGEFRSIGVFARFDFLISGENFTTTLGDESGNRCLLAFEPQTAFTLLGGRNAMIGDNLLHVRFPEVVVEQSIQPPRDIT